MPRDKGYIDCSPIDERISRFVVFADPTLYLFHLEHEGSMWETLSRLPVSQISDLGNAAVEISKSFDLCIDVLEGIDIAATFVN